MKTAVLTEDSFIPRMQKHVAGVSANSSSMRKAGAKGAVSAARKFLARLRLDQFTPENFDERRDTETEALRRALPRRARHWGLARKVLNIFLRDACYNRFLFAHFRLSQIEELLETPLDGNAHDGLREFSKATAKNRLPKWPRLRGEKQDYDKHRARAIEFARERCKGFAPIHADLLLWRARKSKLTIPASGTKRLPIAQFDSLNFAG